MRDVLAVATAAAALVAIAWVRATPGSRLFAPAGLALGVYIGVVTLVSNRKVRRRLPMAPLLADDVVVPVAASRTGGRVIAVLSVLVVLPAALDPTNWVPLVFEPITLFACLAMAYDLRQVAKRERETGCTVVFDGGHKVARPYLIRTSDQAPLPAPAVPPQAANTLHLPDPATEPYLNNA